jgi:hypothetical protein
MIRPATVESIASEFRAVTRRPSIVQLERPLLRLGAPIVHALGARVLTNVFAEDDLATVMGDGSAYDAAARSGADILQSNRPDLMLAIRGARTRPISMLLPPAAQRASIFQ